MKNKISTVIHVRENKVGILRVVIMIMFHLLTWQDMQIKESQKFLFKLG